MKTTSCAILDHATRNHSFDCCYLYFRQPKSEILKNMECSCYALWSFLSSWGMLRNSQLSEKSPACLQPLILYLAQNDLSNIDVQDYADAQVRRRIIDACVAIEEILKDKIGIQRPSLTLVTKIMLGVYSCVPAFDTNFQHYYHNQFGTWCHRINDQTLNNLLHFAETDFGEHNQMTTFFGQPSSFRYNQVKLLDNYAWLHFNDRLAIRDASTDALPL